MQHISTADIELQHNLRLNDRNNFIWGGGARLINEELIGSYAAQFPHSTSNHEILNVFGQNEYALVSEKVYLTLGSKLEYNDFTGLEIEPTSRISWHYTDNQMVWGAVSRAVRTPSTYEEDVNLLGRVLATSPLTEQRLVGNEYQKAEELIAYELGHRIQATKNLQFDTALFYNDYNNLQTISAAGASYTGGNGDLIQPFQYTNLGAGQAFGGEFTANWNVSPRWRLSGNYSYLKLNLDVKPGTVATLDSVQRLAPRNQVSVRSYFNVTDALHWDNTVYFVDNITGPAKAYIRYDTRVAWMALKGVEVSAIGRNLLEPAHAEFPATPQAVIGPSILGQIRLNF